MFPQSPTMNLPKANSPEVEQKMKALKGKLDKYKDAVLKDVENVTSISLLPPPKARPGEKLNKDEVHVFILIDDAKTDKFKRLPLIDKLTIQTSKIAKDIDKNFKPQVMLISELKEACYDAKHDLIAMIATSSIIYDKGLLSALKVSEVHKNMTVKKFEKYVVSYIAVGSLFRGDADPKDIDVAIVIDDTDVKRMSRFELKEKLRAIILTMGQDASHITGIKGAQFHIQTYILTDFWDSLKEANPVIFTMLRDGVPLYDRGVFMPWKLLLQMGRIKPSPEAIDMNREIGEKLLKRTRQKLLSIIGEDLYYALLNPAQAALMLYGLPPPTPKECVKLMEDIFVKKEKLLEKKYVDILESVRKYFKDIEHGNVKSVSGKDVDKLLKNAEDYLKRIDQLFDAIESTQEKAFIVEVHDKCMNVVSDFIEKKVTATTAVKELKSFLSKEKLPIKLAKDLQVVIKAKKDFTSNKLSKQEMRKAKNIAKAFIRAIVDIMESKKSMALDKLRIRFKADKQTGEAFIYSNTIFVIPDVVKKENLFKGQLDKDGKVLDAKKSDLAAYETFISSIENPERILVKIKTIESIKDIVGKEIEIMW
jgi:uncharacterized protein (UPF0332 family)